MAQELNVHIQTYLICTSQCYMKWVLYALFSWLRPAGHWFAYVLGPAKQSKICVIYTNYPAEYQGNKAKLHKVPAQKIYPHTKPLCALLNCKILPTFACKIRYTGTCGPENSCINSGISRPNISKTKICWYNIAPF